MPINYSQMPLPAKALRLAKCKSIFAKMGDLATLKRSSCDRLIKDSQTCKKMEGVPVNLDFGDRHVRVLTHH